MFSEERQAPSELTVEPGDKCHAKRSLCTEKKNNIPRTHMTQNIPRTRTPIFPHIIGSSSRVYRAQVLRANGGYDGMTAYSTPDSCVTLIR